MPCALAAHETRPRRRGGGITQVNNYAWLLIGVNRPTEAKAWLRKKMPLARRVLGESDDLTLRMKWGYAVALCEDEGATLDDLRESVTTLEDAERTARRVLGGAHPTTKGIERALQEARAALARASLAK